MILQQTMMQLSKTENGKESKVKKLVLLWEEKGLCIHEAPYMLHGKRYTISHFNSGKSILRHIKSKEEAKEYMKRLTDILGVWDFTLQEWDQYSNEEKQKIKVEVDKLQKEILEGA